MRIGYSVRNNQLKNNIRSYRQIKSRSEYEQTTNEELSAVFLHNLRVFRKILEFNKEFDLPVYEVSSELIPFPSDPKSHVKNFKKNECILESVKEIRNFIVDNNVRIVVTPIIWNSIISPKQSSREKAAASLQAAADLLDLFALPQDYNAPIVITLNTNRKDIDEKSKKFADIVATLPSNVRDRLVIRNDQKSTRWRIHDLTDHLQNWIHIPVIMDTLFHLENPDGSTIEEALEAACGTWGNYVPVYYYSERKIGAEWINDKLKNKIKNNTRSFLVYSEPPLYLEAVDCIIKARGHEKAAIHARNKHWRWT